MRPRRPRLAATAALLVVAATALGGLAAAPALEPWLARLPDAEQAALRTRAGQWRGWTGDAREAFLARMAEWDARDPATRATLRAHWQAWRELDPVDRAMVRGAAARFDALPESTRDALRARFDALDASAQRGWLLGPRVGADYPALQPLLAQVPEAERLPLLRVLRAMSPAERADLAVLVQRTPPTERAELRRGLLSTSDGNRAAWLRLRLDGA
ncbi:hypothetical protein GCM10028862_20760 [Luteimonas pelagia]